VTAELSSNFPLAVGVQLVCDIVLLSVGRPVVVSPAAACTPDVHTSRELKNYSTASTGGSTDIGS